MSNSSCSADALGVELQFRRCAVRALADGEDAQVAEHLALVREERRIAAFARERGRRARW